MPAADSAILSLLTPQGSRNAELRVHLLPRTSKESLPSPLLDTSLDPVRDETLEPIQLLEAHEYRYELAPQDLEGDLSLHPREIFEPDDESGRTGRLRPGLATGRIPIRLLRGDEEIARTAVEVRSRKFHYLRHYRWMLRDIATHMAELVMERFAVSEQFFAPDDTRDAPTLYQRFEFLQGLLGTEQFDAAIHQILARPYVSWVTEEEHRRPEQGIRSTAEVARQLAAPGPRTQWRALGAHASSLPAIFRVTRTETSIDNLPNRFVKFALTRWRDIVLRVHEALAAETTVAPTERGLREVDAILAKLESLLAEELFREVGDLSQFPGSNQALYKREGYRDIFRAYVQFEVAAKLAWAGGEEIYSAGQRNVAVLYEYWVFLQLARIVSTICEGRADLTPLIQLATDGLGVGLVRGRATRVGGSVSRMGRRLFIDLWFNKTFSGRGPSAESWTRPMRPDATILIGTPEEDQLFEPAWLHFDAKYRLESLSEFMGIAPGDEAEEQEFVEAEWAADNAGSPKRSDLLKMHAYRDAIRRSSGAYVLYPGAQPELRRAYDEILPGLGAFVLRPTQSGQADGSAELQVFLERVLDHFASQLTKHERERFWVRAAHAGGPVAATAPAAAFLDRPPADTLVLLGYVRTREQLEWIHRTHLYNLRAGRRRGAVGLGSQELAAELLVLYGPQLDGVEIWFIRGQPQVLTREQLLETGYPQPGGKTYFCLPIARETAMEVDYPLIKEDVQAAQARSGTSLGEPVAITWLDLVSGMSEA